MSGAGGPARGPTTTIDLDGKDTAVRCRCGRPMWSGHVRVAHGSESEPLEEVNGAIYLAVDLVFQLLGEAERPLLALGDVELLCWRRSWLRERRRVTP